MVIFLFVFFYHDLACEQGLFAELLEGRLLPDLPIFYLDRSNKDKIVI